jgi:hypothetical protein
MKHNKKHMAKKSSKSTKKKSDSHLDEVAIGVGLTTAAVAAAGAYFLYGSKSAAKNRKQVKSWALKAKAEVLEKLEDAKEMSEEEYQELVGSVVTAYQSAKGATKKDLKEFASEMSEHWREIEKAAKPLKKQATKTAKTAKKSAKKATKTAKKAAKKAPKTAAKAAKKGAKK